MTVQINSKSDITDDLFNTYKTAVENAWSGKPQKVECVHKGGKKSLFVTFDTRTHAGEAFKHINDAKVKYWPEMSNIFMINLNV